ncbi:putative Isoflavone reductaseP7 [Fusarium oxysporum f. sp. albedinis]|nr:putative Isoflavone reductaseP7 [Fusarium oxysporum f. sp. albedinis]
MNVLYLPHNQSDLCTSTILYRPARKSNDQRSNSMIKSPRNNLKQTGHNHIFTLTTKQPWPLSLHVNLKKISPTMDVFSILKNRDWEKSQAFRPEPIHPRLFSSSPFDSAKREITDGLPLPKSDGLRT